MHISVNDPLLTYLHWTYYQKIIITKRNCIGFMKNNKKESKIYIHLSLVKNCMQV